METRVCKNCGIDKPIHLFGKSKSAGNGRLYYRHECSQCGYRRGADWREANKERLREISDAAQRRYREKCLATEPDQYRAQEAARQRAYIESVKDCVYTALGGYRCNCCGETQPMFLSIDHVNNDGYKMRKTGAQKSGAGIYSHIWQQFKKTGTWPKSEFQVLCMNCQHGKARNGGVCPHNHIEGVTTIPKGSTAKRPEVHRTQETGS